MPDAVPVTVAGNTEPDHVQRAAVVLVMHLLAWTTTVGAGFPLDTASLHIDLSVGTSVRSSPLLRSQWPRLPPLAHIGGEAFRAPAMGAPSWPFSAE